jgi:protein O-GlcNAc transferase
MAKLRMAAFLLMPRWISPWNSPAWCAFPNSRAMTIQQMLQSAVDHHRAGRLPQAERLYRAILAEQPNHPDALHLLGVLANQTGHSKEACDLIRKAIAQRPTPEYYFNLATAHTFLGELPVAVAALQEAVALNPRLPEAHAKLGVTLHNSGQLDAAILSLRQAVSLKPNNAAFHFYLGNALMDGQQNQEAVDEFTIARRLDPKSSGIQNNLGNALRSVGRLEEAIDSFRRAAEIDPATPLFGSNILFALPFHSDDAELMLTEHRTWDQQYTARFNKEMRPFTNDRDPNRRLRIGYLSPELRKHCQALFTSALFPHHDHEQFEIYCYSAVLMDDAVTTRLQRNADVWRPVSRLSDEAIAQQIRDDGIDILVDLTMHMAYARPFVFARRPAPVQVCWLAYPGTTGLSTMDYRLTDPHLDPPGFEKYYTEQSIHLPETFWCYDPFGMIGGDPEQLPDPNELPALKNGFFTFGCLNDFSKLNAATLQRWGRLMQTVDRSRLRLLAPQGPCRQWVFDQLHPFGISSDRIQFINRQPRTPYLAEYHQIDLCLDTLPYNGHTTSLDAFWMGVPVLTQVGRTVVGRAGLSQLKNLQLLDFAAESEEQFIQLGQRWAADLSELAEIRHTLRDRMASSPLMDGKKFARNMEAAYRQMWNNWITR